MKVILCGKNDSLQMRLLGFKDEGGGTEYY